MNLTTMRYFAAKRELAKAIQRESGLNKKVVYLTPSSFAPSKLFPTGKFVVDVKVSSLPNLFSSYHYHQVQPLSLSMKPMRLPVRCSCHRSVVSVRKNYTTTSDKTRKLMYSFSQLRPFVLHHGTYIPCLSTWGNIFRSKSGEKNTSI